jgi:hypothetical protein
VLFRGWLRHREEGCERVSREATLGVGEVHISRMLRAVPHEHLSVSGEEVKGRGHSARLEFVEWFGVLLGYIVLSSRLRVLAAHNRADGAWVWRMLAADVNVRTLGGAQCGTPPMGRWGFCKRWLIWTVRSTGVGTFSDFKVGGARAG